MTLHDTSETWRRRTELGQAKAREASRRLVLAELLSLGDDLPRGAAEVLADRWAPMFDFASPAVIADHVRRHMSDSDVVRLCLSPEDAAGGPARPARVNPPGGGSRAAVVHGFEEAKAVSRGGPIAPSPGTENPPDVGELLGTMEESEKVRFRKWETVPEEFGRVV